MKKKLAVNIDKELAGKTIESILKRHLEMSASLISRLKRTENAVLLNGRTVRMIDRVKEGDCLEIVVRDREKGSVFKWNCPLDILYEDEDVLVVNKPRSMPTHPSKNHRTDTLANAVAHYLDTNTVFHAITRLDKDTSGVVLIAKNAHSAKILTESVKDMKKEYIAVVNGVPFPKKGTIDCPIGREGSTMRRYICENGKAALTYYEVEEEKGDFSIVHLFPVTGRTHQLRVHLSHIGNPIYGDGMYGALQAGEKTLLHCYKLQFRHPVTKNKIEVIAPVPYDIKRI